MKRAIVLSGGGTRGAYELGVWRALREFGIGYDIVTGTSIGSINGALMVVDDFDRCQELWETLTMEDMMVDGITIAESVTDTMEDFYNQKQLLRPYLKKYLKNKGLDNSPFPKFVEKYVDEERIRASKVDYGLVAVQFPSLKPCVLQKKEIPEGMIQDYVMASSAVFPAFPMHKIGEETFIDGCYYDNLPIDLAIEMGATDVIAVDLHTTYQHPNHAKRPYVKTIHPTQPLGGMLDFHHDRINRNMTAGYRDTLKAYGKLKGFTYYFTPESMKKVRRAAERFCYNVARGEAIMMRNGKSKLDKAGDIYRMFHMFEEYTGDRAVTKEDYFIRAAEICGDVYGMDPDEIYDIREFADTLHRKLDGPEAYPEARIFGQKSARTLIKRLSELKLQNDSIYLTGCLYYASKEGFIDFERQLSVLSYLPHELAAVLFLDSIEEK